MSLKTVLKKADRALGAPISGVAHRVRLSRLSADEERQTQAEWGRFEAERASRRAKYPDFPLKSDAFADAVARLNEDGYAIIPEATEPAVLLEIRRELEAHLDAGSCLNPVAKDSARPPGDRSRSQVFLSEEETGLGQEYFRQHSNYVSIRQPLLNCPTVTRVAFDEHLIDIASTYLECPAALGGLNLRKSYANELPEFDTLYFHVDPNSPRFLKFFYYLNDVDENGGPFCYVAGSHRKRFPGWRSKVRWDESEIAQVYGAGRIKKLTGKVGDLIIADTTGFHRGTKLRGQDRGMLTLDYVAHPEYEGKQEPFEVRQGDLRSLTARQQTAADFLRILPE
jgi:hypothetical protein